MRDKDARAEEAAAESDVVSPPDDPDGEADPADGSNADAGAGSGGHSGGSTAGTGKGTGGHSGGSVGRQPGGGGGDDDDAGADEGVDQAAEQVEVILDDVLTTAESERDEFRDHLLRLQADFDNYRKRVQKELAEAGDKALGRFVEELLPVLDAVDAARAHGATDLDQIAGLLVDLLAKQGLERVGAEGEVFDPTLHDAVLHESGDDDVQTLAQVLRAGWLWRGRVLRPAMVKVIGG